jgi:hypothetical protein
MRFGAALPAAFALLLLGAAAGPASALSGYSQDFEGLGPLDPDALANDGWLVFGNVYGPGGAPFLYAYGAFPAPNGGQAFSAVDLALPLRREAFRRPGAVCSWKTLASTTLPTPWSPLL